ncbi:DUF2141 domain-containing protein [Altererythrobacter lutimaris]|uniref:DUF2141 domain-containing protein n=1 Tax=Altererythrobacter lutimaris TaxID=2743979 RepID=A0A850HDV5_9SPHN|nr:DUF2141 domain-containing protein [Altererythrobacter lutimaris]NVE95301.1 DUF2141 domain-containing protein [Altererythrobacter lutimaris]
MSNFTRPSRLKLTAAALVLGAAGLAVSGFVQAPAHAQSASEYRNKISNNMRACAPGGGPAVRVTVAGIKSATGKIRVQSYRGTKAEWLEKGRWLNRIEAPARKGRMVFCMPLPKEGTYGIAVRHDVNGNGKTDISEDGGAMSNNPSINIFNLGKPSYKKTAFSVGREVKQMTITMKYI